MTSAPLVSPATGSLAPCCAADQFGVIVIAPDPNCNRIDDVVMAALRLVIHTSMWTSWASAMLRGLGSRRLGSR